MIFPVYKPRGPTSNAVLNELRKKLGTRKIGHAGTLDPLAEGVLVVGVGREATKKLSEVVAKEKEYVADIYLGATSETDDAEGLITVNKEPRMATNDEVKKVLDSFVGKIQQIPPIYSAVKIKGREAYKHARAGKMPEMKSREVEIREIEILKYDWPNLKIHVVTGPGVYIRSLARDVGEQLGCGAYLSNLIRTRVGEYDIATAMKILQK